MLKQTNSTCSFTNASIVQRETERQVKQLYSYLRLGLHPREMCGTGHQGIMR